MYLNKMKRLIYSVSFYLLLMVLIIQWKPSVIFDSDGNVKNYGTERGDTIFSLGVISVVLAIMSFYFFAFIDLVFS